MGYLQKQYSTPKEAEIEFFPGRVANTSALLSQITLEDTSASTEISFDRYQELLDQVPSNHQLELLSTLYNNYASKEYSNLSVPSDFLDLSLKAMSRLASNKKNNILFGLARGFGTTREDGLDSLIPISRMPFGLLEYVIEFSKVSPLLVSAIICTHSHL